MSKAREFWAVRNVRTDSYELHTTKPKWGEIPLGDERIHLVEYGAYQKAVVFIKDEVCKCRSVRDHTTGECDLDMCGRCQALKELGEL